jgi:hypothetical protein
MPTVAPSDPALESQVLWERYKKPVLAFVIVVFLGGIAWGGYELYTNQRDSQGAAALAAARTPADFQKVITDFKDTPAGESAYLLLAEQQRNDKKYEESNATLQSFVDKFPKHLLRGQARMGIAANLEMMGKPDEALAMYQRIASDDSKGYIAPIAMISQVHIYREKNQLDDARRICESVLNQYKDSLMTTEANRMLAVLKPKTPGQMLQLQPQTISPTGATGPANVSIQPKAAAPGAPPPPDKPKN